MQKINKLIIDKNMLSLLFISVYSIMKATLLCFSLIDLFCVSLHYLLIIIIYSLSCL